MRGFYSIYNLYKETGYILQMIHLCDIYFRVYTFFSYNKVVTGSSMEQQYTDGTGIDLEQFIHDTLNRSQKDRILLLKIEHELISLVRDAK